MRAIHPSLGAKSITVLFLSVLLFVLADLKVVSAVLEEQHNVFVECLNEATDTEQQRRIDLRMLWETVGLRVSVPNRDSYAEQAFGTRWFSPRRVSSAIHVSGSCRAWAGICLFGKCFRALEGALSRVPRYVQCFFLVCLLLQVLDLCGLACYPPLVQFCPQVKYLLTEL